MKVLSRVIFVLAFIPATTWANSTICKLEETMVGIKAIAWNENDGSAKITDMLNNTYEGVITLTRKHSDEGKKTNIYIKYNKPYYGDDAAEFVVFPVSKNSFRVIGVSYILKGNKQHLNTSKGNYSATCLSM